MRQQSLRGVVHQGGYQGKVGTAYRDAVVYCVAAVRVCVQCVVLLSACECAAVCGLFAVVVGLCHPLITQTASFSAVILDSSSFAYILEDQSH